MLTAMTMLTSMTIVHADWTTPCQPASLAHSQQSAPLLQHSFVALYEEKCNNAIKSANTPSYIFGSRHMPTVYVAQARATMRLHASLRDDYKFPSLILFPLFCFLVFFFYKCFPARV